MPGRPQMVLTDLAEFTRLMDSKYKTAVDLAKASGVNRQTIGWFRTGDRNTTSRKSAEALTKALGVPTNRLFQPWQGDDSSPQEEPVLLTIPQTRAALGGVSETFVYNLIADGDLPTTDIARRGARKSKTRIPLDGLQAYIASRTTRADKSKTRP